MKRNYPLLLAAFVAAFTALPAAPGTAAELQLEPNDRIVFVGNTLAERLRYNNYLETLLTVRFPNHGLTFRNLAWSADEVNLRPRPLNFGDIHSHLDQQRADVIFLCYGVNESYRGKDHLDTFIENYEALINEMLQRNYNGDSKPRLVLVSPTPLEQKDLLPNVRPINKQIAHYHEAIQQLAERRGFPYIDLFTPMRDKLAQGTPQPLTINGIHFNDLGYWVVAQHAMRELGYSEKKVAYKLPMTPNGEVNAALEAIREAITEKNQLFFDRYRAINGFYIYGGRKEPFGVVNFPAEMDRYDELVSQWDSEIHNLAEKASQVVGKIEE